MSYILDALKKSEQERQQGTSPNLYSIHGSVPTLKDSQPISRRHTYWLIAAGFLLFFSCFGILFFLYQRHLDERYLTEAIDPPFLSTENQKSQTSTLAQPDDRIARVKEPSSPLVPVEEQKIEPQPLATDDIYSDSPTVIEPEASQKSLPLLKDLPSKLQAEIPNLKFAGHTYSEKPSQRMIIINDKILREGDLISSNTHLIEITWEGIIIDFSGTRFMVKTN